MLKDELELVRVHAREIAKEELALVLPKKAARDESAWKEIEKLAKAVGELSVAVKSLEKKADSSVGKKEAKGGKDK